MRARFHLTLACALMACAPSQNQPTRFGSFYASMERPADGSVPFTHEEQQAIGRAVDSLDALGPDWHATAWDDGRINVRVARFTSANCNEVHGAGFYARATAPNTVYVDPRCVSTPEQLQKLVAHELMHWYTWHAYHYERHICRNTPGDPGFEEENEDGLCDSFYRGDAVLNPFIVYSNLPVDIDGGTAPPIAVNPLPTALDLALIDALHAARERDP